MSLRAGATEDQSTNSHGERPTDLPENHCVGVLSAHIDGTIEENYRTSSLVYMAGSTIQPEPKTLSRYQLHGKGTPDRSYVTTSGHHTKRAKPAALERLSVVTLHLPAPKD